MDRLYKIVVIILENKEPISSISIANKLGVSVKTVRNDLKKLNDILGKEGLSLVKKPGTGNYIDGPNDNKQLFLYELNKDSNCVEPFSPEGRQLHILKSLLMDDNQITVNKLADDMYVSTTTVYKDLNHIEETLKHYKLKIIRNGNNVLDLKGDEKCHREAISNLVFRNEVEGEPLDCQNEEGSRIDQGTKHQLNTLMKLDYSILEKHINDLEEQLESQFTQEAFISLVIHIAIAIKRIESGNDIILTSETLNELSETKEFESAQEMSTQIGKSFNVIIPKQEIGYITLHILGSNVGGQGLEKLKYNLGKSKEMELAVELAQKMITIASSTLHANLANDHILLNGLALHLRPTINRLKYGLTLRNPLLEDIKSKYPDIFGAAWIAGKVLQRYLDVKIPESEIGYIALHIGAALERNRVRIKTLVVCHSGIGTSQLLSARLKRCFRELEIIGIRASINVKSEDIEETDIIITTVPLDLNINKPVFMISPLFTSDDVKKMEWLIEKYNMENSKDVTTVISKEVFIRSKNVYDKDQIIIDICQSLIKRNYVHNGFIKSAIDREKIYSTEVGKCIAIPHGEPNQVKKPCISVTVLKHPVIWKKEKVEFVFLIPLRDEDLKYAKSIYRNLSCEMEKDEFAILLRSGQVGAMKVLDKLLAN